MVTTQCAQGSSAPCVEDARVFARIPAVRQETPSCDSDRLAAAIQRVNWIRPRCREIRRSDTDVRCEAMQLLQAWIIPAVIVLALATLMLCLIAKQARAQDDSDDEIVIIPNTRPILSDDTMPGFGLKKSEIHRDVTDGSDIIVETWQAADEDTTVDITLYPCMSSQAAFDAARENYQATTEKNQRPVIGKPVPGSFSGQVIGDVCWVYKTSFDPNPNRTESSRSLVFIKGSILCDVLVHSRVSGRVTTALIEQMAMNAANSLR